MEAREGSGGEGEQAAGKGAKLTQVFLCCTQHSKGHKAKIAEKRDQAVIIQALVTSSHKRLQEQEQEHEFGVPYKQGLARRLYLAFEDSSFLCFWCTHSFEPAHRFFLFDASGGHYWLIAF